MRAERPPRDSSRGAITLVELPSPSEGGQRTLRVYIPSEAQRRGAERLPVVVLSDGQNLFARAHAGDHGNWCLDERLEAAAPDDRTPPCIVVGVDHRGVQRISDFTPWADARLDVEPRAARYERFLVDVLSPWIDAHLPATPTRILGGSSLGGLVALFVASRNPRHFSRVAALSPSVMWSDGRLRTCFPAPIEGLERIWLDAGTEERFDAGAFSLDYGGAVRSFADQLRSAGFGSMQLRVELDPQGAHDEASWGRRLPQALRWLMSDLG